MPNRGGLTPVYAMRSVSLDEQRRAGCRLCGGRLTDEFELTVLKKHQVAYFRCHRCKSLQTERPYWLEEAYANNSPLDTGAAQRALKNVSATYAVAKIFGLGKVLDYGGGDGLLCRLLRDCGVRAYVYDKYAEPTYAPAFFKPDADPFDLVTAFEVVEHFEEPKAAFDRIFEFSPRLIMLSTSLYDGQTRDWPYLAADAGQHVFFYSDDALRLIAASHDYELLARGDYVLFLKCELDSAWRRLALRWSLSDLPLRIFKGFLFARSLRFVAEEDASPKLE